MRVVLKPIHSKRNKNLAPRVRAELKAVYRKEAKTAKRELLLPTRRWSETPEMEIEEIGEFEQEISTDDKRYIWTNEGTRPHTIRAKRVPYLKFQRGFRSKTVPGKLTGRAGARFGGYASKKAVKHPGTSPRNWTKLVSERSQARLAKNVPKALARAVR